MGRLNGVSSNDLVGESTSDNHLPEEIRLTRKRDCLQLTFNEGEHISVSAEMLRVKSPSAEVRGHGPNDGITVGGKKNIRINTLEQVGNYAVRISFDDGHDTGIYTWKYLTYLANEHDRIWAEYLSELVVAGLRRA